MLTCSMDPLFEINIPINEKNSRTLVELFCQTIKIAIHEGRLSSGYKMPSTRQFSQIKKVSRNTVIAVYDELCVTGYLETSAGRGTFVKTQKLSKNTQSDNKQKDRLTQYWNNKNNENILSKMRSCQFDFRVGVPNISSFPFQQWRKTINKANREVFSGKVKSVSAQGLLSLREGIVNHLSYSRAVSSAPEQVCITTGAQQALDIICKILIVPGHTKVAMEKPGYPMAKHLFKMHGAIITYIDVDNKGMCIDQIPHDIKIIYTTPSHQFPTGIAMSLERRQALLALASSHNISVIEDDYDGEFRLGSKPIDALKSLDKVQNVFYVGTFSKCMIPDIRLGYCVIPPWAISAFCNAKFHTDWCNSSLIQSALSTFISEGYLMRHIRKMRKCYQQRYEVICDQINLHCANFLKPVHVLSGVHLSVAVRQDINAYNLANTLQKNGFSVTSIAHFEQDSNALNSLVFGFGNITTDEIKTAIPLIAKILKK